MLPGPVRGVPLSRQRRERERASERETGSTPVDERSRVAASARLPGWPAAAHTPHVCRPRATKLKMPGVHAPSARRGLSFIQRAATGELGGRHEPDERGRADERAGGAFSIGNGYPVTVHHSIFPASVFTVVNGYIVTIRHSIDQ